MHDQGIFDQSQTGARTLDGPNAIAPDAYDRLRLAAAHVCSPAANRRLHIYSADDLSNDPWLWACSMSRPSSLSIVPRQETVNMQSQY